ncbi:MAG: hypothetical protein HOW71_25420 [Nonomuraea sp.]|nr:hypothetical protein [Nonomuraea sp.]NUP65506.1 hypothetical protein [Nonomuraea sp.]NUS05990.1 hypothetical protein [Nonomuraea sp.]
MKGNLIVAGGFAVAALFGMAGVANADRYDKSEKCGLSTTDKTTTLRITPYGVSAGRREADACKDRSKYVRPHDDHEHGYWPGHSYWPGRAWSDDSWLDRY